MTTRALFADIASSTGIAFDGEDGRVPRCMTFRIKADGDDLGPAYAEFAGFVRGTLSLVKPDLAGFEAPLVLAGMSGTKVLTNAKTVRILFGLAAIFEMCCGEAKVPVVESNVASIKKYFAGSGRADKSAMMARCRQLGWPTKNDHEADAAAGWSLLKSLREPAWAPRATPLFGRPA